MFDGRLLIVRYCRIKVTSECNGIKYVLKLVFGKNMCKNDFVHILVE